MEKRATVNLADLARLQEQVNRPAGLSRDEVQDYATASLVVMRGLTRGDKLRVIRRMRVLVD